MSDKTPDRPSAPGSGASDAAPTQEIPRVSAKPTSSGSSGSGSGQSSAARTTDKGRPRTVAVEDKPDTSANASSTTDSSTTSSTPSRPLTAGEYAKTTQNSPEVTSVIPAVKDKPATADPEPSEPMPETKRRASLRLTHIDPWSVTKLAFSISVALMIVAVVAMAIFWLVLDATGVWGEINGSITSVLSDNDDSFDITDYLGFGRLVGLTLVLSAINVVVMTALAAIAANLYNLGSQLLGGVEVTFAERD